MVIFKRIHGPSQEFFIGEGQPASVASAEKAYTISTRWVLFLQ